MDKKGERARTQMWPAGNNKHASRGITLMELLVALTIMALVGGVLYPSVVAGLDTLRLKSAADRLANTFRFARERALRRQTVCQVTVDPAGGLVAVEDAGAEPYRRSWEMPRGVVVREERRRTFVFPPDGGAPHIGLTLANARGRTASVEFDLLSALPRARVNP